MLVGLGSASCMTQSNASQVHHALKKNPFASHKPVPFLVTRKKINTLETIKCIFYKSITKRVDSFSEIRRPQYVFNQLYRQ